MTPLKVSLRDQQMALLVDLFEDAATIAYKLCPDLFASEKISYADDVTGSLDKSYFPGVRSGSPGPPPHLLGNPISSNLSIRTPFTLNYNFNLLLIF
jgi:hypothetical protein